MKLAPVQVFSCKHPLRVTSHIKLCYTLITLARDISIAHIGKLAKYLGVSFAKHPSNVCFDYQDDSEISITVSKSYDHHLI